MFLYKQHFKRLKENKTIIPHISDRQVVADYERPPDALFIQKQKQKLYVCL